MTHNYTYTKTTFTKESTQPEEQSSRTRIFKNLFSTIIIKLFFFFIEIIRILNKITEKAEINFP